MKTSLLTLLAVTRAIPAFAGPPPYIPPYVGAAAVGATTIQPPVCVLPMPGTILRPLDLARKDIAIPLPAPVCVDPIRVVPMPAPARPLIPRAR